MKYFICLVLLTACAPNSLEDFQHEGHARCRDLADRLKKIQTRDQLYKAAPQLQKRFEALVDLMIEARRYQITHPEAELLEMAECGSILNAELIAELERIYGLEGGKDIIEQAQREALIRLDAFERASTKQKEFLHKY